MTARPWGCVVILAGTFTASVAVELVTAELTLLTITE
jgi:hypothetical protein